MPWEERFHREIWYQQKKEWLQLSQGGELGWGELGNRGLGCRELGQGQGTREK